jgi:HAD superfamily hydrolase (TIGR01509 family)
MIRNLIFDFDGTLTDSRRDIAGTQLHVLRHFGVDHLREEDLYCHMGNPLDRTFRAVLPEHQHGIIQEAAAMYAAEYPARSLKTTTLFPGVKQGLEELRAMGCGLAVASTKRGPGIVRATDHFGITHLFDRLQGSENIPFKPDPTIVRIILRELGWAASDTLLVGDSDNDIRAGQAAGIATCGVSYGAWSRDKLASLHPEFLVDKFLELVPIVSRSREHATGT